MSDNKHFLSTAPTPVAPKAPGISPPQSVPLRVLSTPEPPTVAMPTVTPSPRPSGTKFRLIMLYKVIHHSWLPSLLQIISLFRIQ
ncbi:hypothetical protein DPMN_000815 [Dreissena polymorpha]|uniref:Uncharacterized protein n=1 Tax=Dreissena polymorpha TaxID=45954 RepID=A0A9D4RSH1_DREPO|nr:hypothetical protein DPMN_000815 [Dreissena polymorpha]